MIKLSITVPRACKALAYHLSLLHYEQYGLVDYSYFSVNVKLLQELTQFVIVSFA